jgi:outer membrane lipoprotein SlyB
MTARCAGFVLLGTTLFATVPVGAIESDRLKYGEVVNAEQVLLDAPPGSGTRSGATVGAIVGFALADDNRWLGAALGGVVGGAIGSGAQKKKGWHLGVRLDNGEEIGVAVFGRKDHYSPGDKVRLLTLEDGTVSVYKRPKY